MDLHIKNMVCGRCIKTVTTIFEQAGIVPESVTLGVVKLKNKLSEGQEQQIKELLKTEGFEWLDDQHAKLIEEIKRSIIELVHYSNLDDMNKKLSGHLAEKLRKDYHYLSHLFSSVENTTIEQYFILQKTEKVKEWLVYNEFTLSEMAFRLGYSSVAHLSGQFKKTTGFTPSQFKNLKDRIRKPLDKL
jgi:AraC-like DNA-binding protein